MRKEWGRRVFQVAALTTFLILGGITIFLFREALPAIIGSPYEEIRFGVHPTNPLHALTSSEARALIKGERTWASLGGPHAPLVLVHLGNIERYLQGPLTTADVERCIDSLADYRGVLFALPPSLMPTKAKPIRVSWNSVKELFLSIHWSPTYEPVPSVGVWPLILGSLWVSFIGLLVVVPLGIAMAVYAVEFLPKHLYYPLKIMWEMLAGLPSVIVGFWGLVVLVPWIQKVFRLNAGETALTAGLLLGWMTLPLMASLVEEALQAIPPLLSESSYGLGATQWQTILRLKLPYVMPSIVTATLLSAGRILGETMVVLMVSGNAPLLSFTPLAPVRTLPATLAAELGEAPVGSYHYSVLFLLGSILFIVTLLLNIAAYSIRPRHGSA
ncbi:MAG: phosphate ABC transporter permease subunit PstC [Bacteroidia bacterium]|nr:phosphate ABC transporter permease subunit PstC [Bacteroidia bacterium]MDW8134659.1 phosphate ABC transporter permease subunit PstC [Bacteroidia bacterium]